MDELRPTAFISGDGDENSGMVIYGMEMTIDGKVVAEYKSPVELSIGKVDERSRKQGSALFTISTDGKSTVGIKEEGSGRVTHQTKEEFVIEAIGIKGKTENWRAELKVKTWREDLSKYFDLLLIRRNRGERDHVNDPHIGFYPDGSGKYIRYDLSKDIKWKIQKPYIVLLVL